jgi:hypothetical protein
MCAEGGATLSIKMYGGQTMRSALRLALPALALCALSAAAPRSAQAQQRIRCESHANDRSYCNADIRGGVTLVRQLSSAACQRGRTWGTSRQGVWVSNGCRADFETSYNGNGGYNRANANNNGRWNRTNSRWDRSGSSSGLSSDAANRCRSEVLSRIVKRNDGDVQITGGRYQSNVDSYMVDWVSGREYGQCQVSSNGRVIIEHHRR